MSTKEQREEYQSLSNAASELTIDSPFFSTFGNLTHLLTTELESLKTAQKENQEIEIHKIPVEGTTWVSIETIHPTKDVTEILVQLNSLASEGIACALIIILANTLQSLSKSFNKEKSIFHVCNAGPSVGEVKWADLVIAASNYVRHQEEWAEDFENKKLIPRQLKSIEQIEKSGISGVRQGKLSFLNLVIHLQIDNWDKLINNLSNWLNCCLPYHSGAPRAEIRK